MARQRGGNNNVQRRAPQPVTQQRNAGPVGAPSPAGAGSVRHPQQPPMRQAQQQANTSNNQPPQPMPQPVQQGHPSPYPQAPQNEETTPPAPQKTSEETPTSEGTLDDEITSVYDHLDQEAEENIEDDDYELTEKPKRSLSRRLFIGGSVLGGLAATGAAVWHFWAQDYVAPVTNDIPDEYSASAALLRFQDALNSNSTEKIFSNGYFVWENKYAQRSSYQQKLLETLLSKVKYTIPEVDEVTTKGRLTGRKIRADLTHPEDTVELEVPALEQYVFDELEIKNAYSDVATKITEKTGDKTSIPALKAADSYYSSIDVFCYLLTKKLEKNYLKETHREWSPKFVEVENKKSPTGSSWKVSPEEEQRINDLLFGKAFLKAIMNFSSAHMKAPIPQEWSGFFNSEEGVEPLTLPPGFTSVYWAGAHRLLEVLPDSYKNRKETVLPILPPSGKGTKEEPYGVNTRFASTFFAGDKKIPMAAEIIDIKTGEDAAKYFVSVDDRNKGMYHYSKREYVYMRLRVTNIGGEKATIKDDFTLIEKGGTIRNAPGTVYGLKPFIDLEPSASGFIDVWSGSDSLQDDFFAWGKSNPSKDGYLYLTKSRPTVNLGNNE